MSMDTAKDDISLCSADAPSRLYSMCATLEITQDDIYDYMMKQKKNYRRGDQGEIGPRRKGRWGVRPMVEAEAVLAEKCKVGQREYRVTGKKEGGRSSCVTSSCRNTMNSIATVSTGARALNWWTVMGGYLRENIDRRVVKKNQCPDHWSMTPSCDE